MVTRCFSAALKRKVGQQEAVVATRQVESSKEIATIVETLDTSWPIVGTIRTRTRLQRQRCLIGTKRRSPSAEQVKYKEKKSKRRTSEAGMTSVEFMLAEADLMAFPKDLKLLADLNVLVADTGPMADSMAH
jgi:hypothetical protein